MSQELIISISGMRGIVGENLTPEIAAAYGCAFGAFLRERKPDKKLTVAVGRDSRPSGQMVFSAVAAGLAAGGVNVVDLGICSTPGVGIMVRHLHCDGGVIITASHNPIPWNGIKLLLDNGIAPPRSMAEDIIGRYHQRAFFLTDSLHCGKITCNGQTPRVHTEKVMAVINPALIAEKQYKVVLDSVNGAGGVAGRYLLEKLGCEVIPLNIEPTGLFAHTPEPTAENLTDLCGQVKQHKAHIGFAQDPDADRLAIVDEQGRYIGEEYSLALAARYVFSKQSGTAAANLSTSRMIDDIAAAAGGSVIRTAVGEANVAEAMLQHHCIIGGEGNGGVIDLRIGPVRDSLVAMALVLQLMAETSKPVGKLADEIGNYVMVKTKYPADKQQAQAMIEKAKTVFAEARMDTTDGCRLDLPDGWIHIRTSNTEPIMRIIMEAKDPDTVRRWTEQIETIRKEVL
ncbi:MAG TPA: phosphoglucosamine mutase [Phycisphaerales bacterium]|nr:phosphoglucosamine mutase [Phycisphaerales bacterium]